MGEIFPEEEKLIQLIGSETLKKIGEQIATILRENGLHRSPEICTDLFHYMDSVVRRWNEL